MRTTAGSIVPVERDRRVEERFNAALDAAGDWAHMRRLEALVHCHEKFAEAIAAQRGQWQQSPKPLEHATQPENTLPPEQQDPARQPTAPGEAAARAKKQKAVTTAGAGAGSKRRRRAQPRSPAAPQPATSSDKAFTHSPPTIGHPAAPEPGAPSAGHGADVLQPAPGEATISTTGAASPARDATAVDKSVEPASTAGATADSAAAPSAPAAPQPASATAAAAAAIAASGLALQSNAPAPVESGAVAAPEASSGSSPAGAPALPATTPAASAPEAAASEASESSGVYAFDQATGVVTASSNSNVCPLSEEEIEVLRRVAQHDAPSAADLEAASRVAGRTFPPLTGPSYPHFSGDCTLEAALQQALTKQGRDFEASSLVRTACHASRRVLEGGGGKLTLGALAGALVD